MYLTMQQRNTTNENIRTVQESFTIDAQERLQIVQGELLQRRSLGLIPPEGVTPMEAIKFYLDGVSKVDPLIDQLTSNAAEELKGLPASVEMVMTIPILGLDNQELQTARKLIEVLSQQEDIVTGKVAVFIYVNWPEGRECDGTMSSLTELAEKSMLPLYVFKAAVPKKAGRSESPVYAQSYQELEDGPQIALIRDILNITVMKKLLACKRKEIPLILQSDADLIETSDRALRNIMRCFNCDSVLQFIQCNVDWDGELPTKEILPLLLGSILMRELPWQILKQPLNGSLSKNIRRQIIFSNAIQRGIQVAQVERLDSIARKGGYGLLKIHEDELDLNIRSTAEVSGVESIGTTDDTFIYSNRRAIASWYTQAIPPIGQWATEFEIDDPVRTKKVSMEDVLARINERGIKFEIINAVRLTLQRFSIPQYIDTIYESPSDAILTVLQQFGLNAKDLKYEMVSKEDGNYYLDVQDISDEGIIALITTLSELV
jgi:hypothetical protein